MGKVILKEGFEVILYVDTGWIYEHLRHNKNSFGNIVNILVQLCYEGGRIS